jgi:hypothetical protein
MSLFFRSDSTIQYMLSFGADPKILLRLPIAFLGIHQGVTNRLAYDGVIRKDKKIRVGNSYRMQWKAGPRLPGLLKWGRLNGYFGEVSNEDR